MRILQVVYSGDFGGLEKYTLQLTDDLSQMGIDVELCVLHAPGFVTKEANKRKIRNCVIGIKNGFDLLGIVKFMKFINNESYDIIHLHDRTFLIILALVFFPRALKIFTDHGGEVMGRRRWKRILFYKLFSFAFRRVIANSNATKYYLEKFKLFDANKIHVVHNGIDLGRFKILPKIEARKNLKVSQNAKIVGFVGRIVFGKGVDLFIRTAIEISRLSNDYEFIILGDGPELGVCKRLVSKEKNIHFLGYQECVDEWLSAFDVLLFTSRWESFGLVLLEAMAAGVPIVGFDIPGANEVAINGETALLVEPYKISDLATRVLQVMSDKELYSQLSEQGKKRVEGSFSSSKNSSTVLFIYRQMLLNV